MTDTRKRLLAAAARSEAAARRNDADRDRLRTAAHAMGDQATTFLAGVHDRACAADPTALSQAFTAMRGRAIARRTARS